MSLSDQIVVITMSKETLKKMKFDAADISCWFMGFAAACKDDIKLPPGLSNFEFEFNEMIRKAGV